VIVTRCVKGTAGDGRRGGMLAKLWRPSLRSALPFAAGMPSAGGSFPGLDPGASGPGDPVEVGTDSQPEQLPGYGTWQASSAARGFEESQCCVCL